MNLKLQYFAVKRMVSKLSLILLLLLLVACFRECWSVRFAYLGVPGAVLSGEGVWLDCGYDLEDDKLYSVKWYKDNYEFYRYLPSDHPPSQKYVMSGVNVNLERSNSSHAYLEKVDMSTEGTYACEVSTDGPFFKTIRSEKDLFVYVMPDTGPLITGVLNQYPIGDEINVTCFFGPSKPAAELTWYINGEEVKGRELLPPYISKYVLYKQQGLKSDQDEVESVESRLQFVVDPTQLWKGALNLHCTASLNQMFYKSSEEIILGDGTSGSEFNRVAQVAPGLEGPNITGNMLRYENGDFLSVDINCTSAKSLHVANLQWYINDEKANLEYIIKHRPIIYPDGRVSTRLGLRFRASESQVKIGEETRLKCTSTMSKRVELIVVETIFFEDEGRSGFWETSGRANTSFIRRGLFFWCRCVVFPISTVIFVLR